MVLCAQQLTATLQCEVAKNSLAAVPLYQALFLVLSPLPWAGMIYPAEKGQKACQNAAMAFHLPSNSVNGDGQGYVPDKERLHPKMDLEGCLYKCILMELETKRITKKSLTPTRLSK